jgi:hypothetical protein
MERSIASEPEWPRLPRDGTAYRIRPGRCDRRKWERRTSSTPGELTLDLAPDPIHQ